MSSAAPDPARLRRDPFRWVVENPGPIDGVVFGAITVALLVLGLLTGTTGEPWWWFSVPMFAAGAIGRTRPALASGIIAALAVLHFAVGQQLVLGDVMIFYVLYTVTALGRPLARRLTLAGALAGAALQALAFGVLTLRETPGASWPQALFMLALVLLTSWIAVGGTWALGRYQHARVEQLRMARAHAEQAEREREQRATIAVADERARIAREMHDVVAHSLSVIIAQADGGRFIASQDPAQAGAVLETIGATGRAALADMRSLLGVLRAEEESGYGPQPDLEDLPELIERVRAAGLAVTAEITGDFSDLPASLGLSMFRLVQEALTNVLKHAGPGASAMVRVQRRGSELAIDVLDDGRGHDPDSDGAGHGLTGMRERVTLHGGTLQAGPLPSRGFRISARVPLADGPGVAAHAVLPATAPGQVADPLVPPARPRTDQPRTAP